MTPHPNCPFKGKKHQDTNDHPCLWCRTLYREEEVRQELEGMRLELRLQKEMIREHVHPGSGDGGTYLPSGRAVFPSLGKPDIDDVYTERNLIVQLCAYLTRFCPRTLWDAWRGTDPTEPDWPVIYIKTPAGQISYHMPREELLLNLPDMTGKDLYKWDEHTNEEKYERIKKLLKGDD